MIAKRVPPSVRRIGTATGVAVFLGGTWAATYLAWLMPGGCNPAWWEFPAHVSLALGWGSLTLFAFGVIRRAWA